MYNTQDAHRNASTPAFSESLRPLPYENKRRARLMFNDAHEVNVSGHKFKVGQLVNYLTRGGSLGVYQVTELLPPEGGVFQYRIKNVNEPHERMAKEHELRSAG
jgi:hypothetical protein